MARVRSVASKQSASVVQGSMRALKRSVTAVRVVMDPEFADARVFAAAQKLQSAWRNKARRAKGRRFRAAFEQARRRRRRQIESKAALQLQRLWRGRMIRCVRMVKPTTFVVTNPWMLYCTTRKAYRFRHQQHHVVNVQRVIRGFLARQRTAQLWGPYRAARMIQVRV